jgi:crossover junction endodeoxyribonuclease RusA
MSSMCVTLDLPYPPSVNTFWRRWRGKVVLARAAREFRQRVAERWLSYRHSHRHEGFGRSLVACRVTVCPPDARRRDLDNILKALFDAIQHAGIIEDDSQIRRLEVAFGRCPQPGLRVVMWQLNHEDSEVDTI